MTKRVIFSNLMNYATADAFSEEYAIENFPLEQRDLWTAEEGDVLVTHKPISDAFKAYACRVIGLASRAVFTLSPNGGSTETLVGAVRRSGLNLKLRDAAVRGHRMQLSPYAVDMEVVELATELGMGLEGYDGGVPSPEVVRLIRRLNTKSEFRQLSEEFGLQVISGDSGVTSSELAETLRRRLSVGTPQIVKVDRTSGGFGHLVVHPEELGSLDEQVARHLVTIPDVGRNAEFVIEEFLDAKTFPTVQMRVDARGAKMVFVTDQRCHGPAAVGMRAPCEGLNASQANTLLEDGRRFASFLADQGYRGHADLDALITRSGELFYTESNIRKTGISFAAALVDRLWQQSPNEPAGVWITDGGPGRRIAFNEAVLALEHSRIAWCPVRRSGVLLTMDTVQMDGKWRYMVLAHDADEAEKLEATLGEILELDISR